MGLNELRIGSIGCGKIAKAAKEAAHLLSDQFLPLFSSNDASLPSNPRLLTSRRFDAAAAAFEALGLLHREPYGAP